MRVDFVDPDVAQSALKLLPVGLGRLGVSATVRRWFVLAIVALVLGLGMAFLAIGTAHRDSCAQNGSALIGCSLLPWSGHASDGDAVLPGQT